MACANAKARCDNRRPRCERCAMKNLRCQFQDRSTMRDAHSAQNLESTAHGVGNESSETAAIEKAVPTFPPLDESFGITENTDTDFEVPEFSEQWDLINFSPPPSSSSTLYTQTQQQATHSTDPLFISKPPPFTISTSIPAMPTYALRSFTQRSTRTNTTATLILRILTSYPKMLQDPTSPPPFIHPSFLNNDDETDSLGTCASLMHLLGPRNQHLLWKNVRLECERLTIQVRILFQLKEWEEMKAD
jgi:hypothetical protein